MTREILFKGKRLDNGEWVYGAYHKHDTVKVCITGDDPKTKHIIIADGFCDWGFEPPLMGYHVAPATVGQFTGLCDKNGKKIFEGDIVSTGKMIHQVRFRYGAFELLRGAATVSMYAMIGTDVTYEVIGNIHDNPELLEE